MALAELTDRVAVVTGAASGIGRALTDALVAEGARVVMADIEAPRLADAAAQVRAAGGTVLDVVCDVADPASVAELGRVAAEVGPVDLVCNNAGVGGNGLVHEADLDTWAWVIGVNLMGVVHGVRTFVPSMIERGRGHVVNTASIAGLVSFPEMGPYNVTKHAVVTLSETLWQEQLRLDTGVGVSVVCPGFVDTGIIDSARNRPGGPPPAPLEGSPEAARRDAVARAYAAATPPAQVAELVVEAVRTGRFYVMTDDSFGPAIARRHREIETGAVPAPTGHLAEVLFAPADPPPAASG